jgi:predicted DNA binding CopG/RHH family protein
MPISMKNSQREGEPMVKLTVRLSSSLIERTKIRAIKDRLTVQDLVNDALEAYLKSPAKRGGIAQ